MLEFLKNIKKKDPSSKNYLEIILCYPGVHSMFFYRIANFLDRLKIPIIPKLISYFSQIITAIEIHPKAKIGKNLFIDHGIGVVIGETAIIKNNVTMYHNVTLGARVITQEKRHPTIEDGVIIGAGSKIIGNITIGKNSKIGANSLILESQPQDSIIVSNKAIRIASEIEYYI